MPSRNSPDETPEEVIERTRREHGDEAAEVVRKAIFGETPPVNHNGRRKVFSGVKPKPSPAIPSTRGNGPGWKEAQDYAQLGGGSDWWAKADARNERRKANRAEALRRRRNNEG